MRMLVNARNRSIAIESGRIVSEGGGFDLIVDVPDADVRPGLINAHDHLHRNHYGRLGRPPYRNASSWAADIQQRYRRRIASRRSWPRRSALLAGAWKNLFAGVTTVVHHDPWEADFERAFPLRVVPVVTADSVHNVTDLNCVSQHAPFCIHLAEGVDEAAAEEVRELERRGYLTSKLVAVHAVGVDDDGAARLQACEAAIAWCPTSNLFLLGRTAPASLLDSELDLLLGSDSLLTGQGDLLDELRVARRLALVSDERLVNAVGEVSARRLGLPVPTLDPGAAADLVLLRKPLSDAGAEDVAMVIVDGVPRVAESGLAARLASFATHGSPMRVGSVTRWANTTDYGGAAT